MKMKKQKVKKKKIEIMKIKIKMMIMNMKMIKQQIKNKIIKEKNGGLDKIIDKSKSFEDQIKSLKKVENLDDDYYDDDFDDKELKYKYFKIKLAQLSNEIDESYLNKYLVIHLQNQQIN